MSTASEKVINGGSRERALEGAEFQRGTQFLKSNSISFADSLTSNKHNTIYIIKAALFSCYVEEYADFVPFSGASGAWPRLAPIDPPLKAIAPPPPSPVNTYTYLYTYKI